MGMMEAVEKIDSEKAEAKEKADAAGEAAGAEGGQESAAVSKDKQWMRHLMEQAWEGRSVPFMGGGGGSGSGGSFTKAGGGGGGGDDENDGPSPRRLGARGPLAPAWDAYLVAAGYAKRVADHPKFTLFITACIFAAGILVGVSTEVQNATLTLLDEIILVVFTFEVVVKIMAEGGRPLHYFDDNWNRFDSFIVAASILPRLIGLKIGAMVSMLRLLRLLRALKLMRSMPQLQGAFLSVL